jgi:hypothetical protein
MLAAKAPLDAIDVEQDVDMVWYEVILHQKCCLEN